MWHLMSLTLSFVCYLSTINRGEAAPVNSVDDAMEYLEKFGYFERGHQDSSYAESVSAETFRTIFEDFQSFAGLKKTGMLDFETLELMNKPRCGVPDRVRPGSSSTRRKRFALEGSDWPKTKLTYKIKKYTPDMSKSDVDSEIARAFQMWQDVTDLTFVQITNQSANVDIDILFATGEHGNCRSFKDEKVRVQAHAAYPRDGGDAHFNDGETWTLNSDKGTNLFQVATHEFGHSLGLGHTNLNQSVMYPIWEYRSDFKLDKDDIEGIQELYGKNQFSRKLALELKASIEYLRTTVNNLEEKNVEQRNDLNNTQMELNNKLEGIKMKSEARDKIDLETRTNLSTQLKKTMQELVETRVDFVKTVDGLSANLYETKQELVKTREDFIKTVDDLSTKLNATDKELAETKFVAENLSTELKKNKQELVKTRGDFIKTVNYLSTKLNATNKELADTKFMAANMSTDLKTNLATTRTELKSTKSDIADLATKLNARTSELVDIGQMPTSCEDLERMGHKLSGFFSVKGSKKMEMIYCKFFADKNEMQKWIGYADVKSAPVHFYAQRNSSFSTESTPISFDLARVNEGNAMNLTTGKFTAPRPGIYFFSFTGHARISDPSPYYFYSSLYLNGKQVGRSFVREDTSFTAKYNPLTLQCTLNLKKDDLVWVTISYSGSSSLYDDGYHFTHFTGFVLEEEIVASL